MLNTSVSLESTQVPQVPLTVMVKFSWMFENPRLNLPSSSYGRLRLNSSMLPSDHSRLQVSMLWWTKTPEAVVPFPRSTVISLLLTTITVYPSSGYSIMNVADHFDS